MTSPTFQNNGSQIILCPWSLWKHNKPRDYKLRALNFDWKTCPSTTQRTHLILWASTSTAVKWGVRWDDAECVLSLKPCNSYPFFYFFIMKKNSMSLPTFTRIKKMTLFWWDTNEMIKYEFMFKIKKYMYCHPAVITRELPTPCVMCLLACHLLFHCRHPW